MIIPHIVGPASKIVKNKFRTKLMVFSSGEYDELATGWLELLTDFQIQIINVFFKIPKCFKPIILCQAPSLIFRIWNSIFWVQLGSEMLVSEYRNCK